MDDAQALLTRLYEAYNRRDFAAFSALLAADVDWPDQVQSGRLIGHDAVAAYWSANDKVITVDSAPVSFSTLPDGRIAVDVNQIVRNLAGRIWSGQLRAPHLHAPRRQGGAHGRRAARQEALGMSAATDLIARYYDAIERRDLDAVLATTHARVRFHDYLDGGEVEGLAAARDFYRRMFDLAPDLT